MEFAHPKQVVPTPYRSGDVPAAQPSPTTPAESLLSPPPSEPKPTLVEEEEEGKTSEVPAAPKATLFEEDDATLEVPALQDKRAPRPVTGEHTLSQSAINSRLRRLMTPNLHGKYKLSQSIVEQFKSGPAGKKQVQKMFQAAGYCPDWVATKAIQKRLFRFVSSSGPAPGLARRRSWWSARS